ncbi:unnamed protein product [Euphydryas editha]|uniref:Uncharacterized protein n=1 Tax=Euphydryas editha TaxID=104508 RepID=A0AAU9UEJ0_EUPED|nr:unnamed protein product [Euphydryas editha]
MSVVAVSVPRDGSIGAASLGAQRDAPVERKAPSVRSDERPLATQGDMLNSIKFQRRLRENLTLERHGNKSNDKASTVSKEKSCVRHVNSRSSTIGTKPGVSPQQREKTVTNITRAFQNTPRPTSPKGRKSPHPPFY